MRTILITGATDGIGLALAHLYQREDARLVLIGRRPLSTLTDPLFHRTNYCQLDLNDEHCMAALSSWLQEQGIHQLDLVIHNAAVGYVGVPAAQSPANLRAMVQVNLWAPIALSHMLFPLVERARGKLVFISSVATALPSPEYATYTATKAALEGFVRSWQVELAAEQSPVTLQIIRPGATRTAMHAKSGADLQKLRPERFPSAATVAGFIASKIAHPTRTATVGALNRLIYAVAQTIEGLVDFSWQRLHRRSRALPAGQMTQGERRHCVITGAADGIGRALAEAFAEAGYIITGIDVDRERAQQLTEAMTTAGHTITFLAADLAALDDLPTVVEALQERPPIDLFIHNAGISAVGPFSSSNLARQRAVLDINFTAPLLLTGQLLHKQLLAPEATFAFISSLSRFTGYPGATVYAATKDGIASYARSLGVAIASAGHHVLTIYPGPTRTAHARRYSPDNRREMKRMPPEQLAALIVQAVQARRRTLIPGIANRSAAWLGKLLPTVAEQLMRRTIYQKLPRP